MIYKGFYGNHFKQKISFRKESLFFKLYVQVHVCPWDCLGGASGACGSRPSGAEVKPW